MGGVDRVRHGEVHVDHRPPLGEPYSEGDDDPDCNLICWCPRIPKQFCMECAGCAARGQCRGPHTWPPPAGSPCMPGRLTPRIPRRRCTWESACVMVCGGVPVERSLLSVSGAGVVTWSLALTGGAHSLLAWVPKGHVILTPTTSASVACAPPKWPAMPFIVTAAICQAPNFRGVTRFACQGLIESWVQAEQLAHSHRPELDPAARIKGHTSRTQQSIHLHQGDFPWLVSPASSVS